MLQSFALLTGPFAVPSSVPQALWAVGSTHTCTANGFLFSLGSMSTPMYTLFLCVYSYFKIRKNMSDQEFTRKIEWKLHALIIIISLSVCISALVMRALNSATIGNFCLVSAVPAGCRQNPEVFGECDKTVLWNVTVFSYLTIFGIPFVCLAGIVGSMISICKHVIVTRNRVYQGRGQTEPLGSSSSSAQNSNDHHIRKKELRISKLRDRTSRETVSSALKDESDSDQHVQDVSLVHGSDSKSGICLPPHHNQNEAEEYCNDEYIFEHDNSGRNSSKSQTELEQKQAAEDLVRSYRRDFVVQALLYVVVFIIPFGFWWSCSLILIFWRTQPPLILALLTTILYPMGGLFNIYVYTRPKVTMLRRSNTNYSWFHAFWLVIKAGSVTPTIALTPSKEADESPNIAGGISSLTECHDAKTEAASLVMRHRIADSIDFFSIDTPPAKLSSFVSSEDSNAGEASVIPFNCLRNYYKWPESEGLDPLDEKPDDGEEPNSFHTNDGILDGDYSLKPISEGLEEDINSQATSQQN